MPAHEFVVASIRGLGRVSARLQGRSKSNQYAFISGGDFDELSCGSACAAEVLSSATELPLSVGDGGPVWCSNCVLPYWVAWKAHASSIACLALWF